MTERRTIMHHAATVLVGQLAVMAFGITDTWVAGRYADTALAALSVASATYITVHISLMGILQALLPVWAELQGAQKFSDVGRSVICLPPEQEDQAPPHQHRQHPKHHLRGYVQRGPGVRKEACCG